MINRRSMRPNWAGRDVKLRASVRGAFYPMPSQQGGPAVPPLSAEALSESATIEARLRPPLTAANLRRLTNIKLKWGSYLDEHLVLVQGTEQARRSRLGTGSIRTLLLFSYHWWLIDAYNMAKGRQGQPEPDGGQDPAAPPEEAADGDTMQANAPEPNTAPATIRPRHRPRPAAAPAVADAQPAEGPEAHIELGDLPQRAAPAPSPAAETAAVAVNPANPDSPDSHPPQPVAPRPLGTGTLFPEQILSAETTATAPLAPGVPAVAVDETANRTYAPRETLTTTVSMPPLTSTLHESQAADTQAAGSPQEGPAPTTPISPPVTGDRDEDIAADAISQGNAAADGAQPAAPMAAPPVQTQQPADGLGKAPEIPATTPTAPTTAGIPTTAAAAATTTTTAPATAGRQTTTGATPAETPPPFFPMPLEVIEETLKSLYLLLPPGDYDTQPLLSKETQLALSDRRDADDHPEDVDWEPRRRQKLRSFTFYHDRLLDLASEYLDPPRNWTTIWRDSRNTAQYWTFWIGLVIFVATVVFGTLASVLAGVQLHYAQGPPK
ncbi:hypothetical protein GGTG_00743 [Gaeumannomyces tritici R3-111a-1]|uniref:Uncharacterized protein n=1 Tax=Gaeumannomyces tritici (strain R3-111a-1) TaxID=644352 RepID=J3NHK6_GAET3|nr:hypothetical protein GGTG_00743 [Gaeumannomyces tritici R3-111a-1]EJT80749.1 hypothetical protein GGTG_00743 [Gaeumannomyces tritici R3-111a-1]